MISQELVEIIMEANKWVGFDDSHFYQIPSRGFGCSLCFLSYFDFELHKPLKQRLCNIAEMKPPLYTNAFLNTFKKECDKKHSCARVVTFSVNSGIT